ncbi:MAG: hypothetical protein KAJ21_05130 [Thermoplasmatales archaeon]|jgi:uncharacterized membrane protein|nr:hypothetical protein [Thermoplasmatales archaeon]
MKFEFLLVGIIFLLFGIFLFIDGLIDLNIYNYPIISLLIDGDIRFLVLMLGFLLLIVSLPLIAIGVLEEEKDRLGM